MSDDTPTDEDAPEPDFSALTDQHRHLITLLPATAKELARELRVSRSTVRDHIYKLRQQDVNISAQWEAENECVYFLDGQPKVRRISTKATGSKTREANEWATEMEATILRRLRNKDPLRAPVSIKRGNEDMVVHMTDVHMGDVVEDQRGVEAYNPEITTASVEHVTEKTLYIKRLMEPVTAFDVCHLVWGGDMVTNENIYEGQAYDISLMLADQLSHIVDALVHQVKSLAPEFDYIQIVAQPGNHGKSRASGVSKQANMDLLAYRWVLDRLIEAGIENVNFIGSEATPYRTFYLRGTKHKALLMHGEDAMPHVDATAASSRDWRGWLIQSGFDIAYRGHYHESRREPVLNGPFVIESPSMKPGGEFATRIGQPDCGVFRRLATVHGVSDDRAHTWEYVIDDIDMDMQQFAPTSRGGA